MDVLLHVLPLEVLFPGSLGEDREDLAVPEVLAGGGGGHCDLLRFVISLSLLCL